MKKDFKTELKKYFEEKSLSQEQLNSLHNIQKKIHRRRYFHFGLVGVIVAGFIAAFIIIQNPATTLSQRIVQEVTYNHNKRMTMEIKSASLTEIQNYLSRLDFSLIQSNQLATTHWLIMGARYCSLLGKTAVQIKIKKIDSDQLFTLYQVPLSDEMKKAKLTKYHTIQKGTEVSYWIEDGLMLALAGPKQ